jgi:hypothetical protein
MSAFGGKADIAANLLRGDKGRRIAANIAKPELAYLPTGGVTVGTRRRRCGNTIQTDKADEVVQGDLPCCGIRRFS